MSISSPLEVDWAHAYWAEGPQFTALGVANGGAVTTWPDEMETPGSGGLVVGFMSLTLTTPAVVGDDLTQATAGNKPTYRSNSAAFNSKPIVEFDGTTDYLTTTWTTGIPFPYTVWAVVRNRTLDGNFRLFWADNPSTSNDHGVGVNSANDWLVVGNNGAQTGGAANTNAHALRMNALAGANMILLVDEVTKCGGAANVQANSAMDGLTLGARSDPTVHSFLDVAFLGVMDRTLTAGEISDLDALASSYWGTP